MIFFTNQSINSCTKTLAEDINSVGWKKVLCPRSAPTTKKNIFYLDNSKCINSSCEFTGDDFNFENGRELLFHVSKVFII